MESKICQMLLFAAVAGAGACGGTGDELAAATQALVPAGEFLTLASPTNTLSFRAQAIGTASDAQQLTLLNAGTASLTITSVGFIGAAPADYALGPLTTCAAAVVVAPGATCVVDVSFTPSAAGPRSARIAIADSADGTPHAIPVIGTGTIPGAAVASAGPIDLRIGDPAYYQDTAGLKLQLCYDNATLCPTTVADPAVPPLVADTGSNFIDESFYWMADTQNQRVGPGLGGRARLVMALEAAFLTDGVLLPGDQLVFGRIRIRLQKMTANASYTVTYPYGTKVFVADAGGAVDETVDIGCAATPCDFRSALDSPILASPFLRWDPAVAPAAPAGFLGDPNVAHAITGSPNGTNFFRIAGPNAGGTGVNTITFTGFSLAGEILP